MPYDSSNCSLTLAVQSNFFSVLVSFCEPGVFHQHGHHLTHALPKSTFCATQNVEDK